MKKQAGFTLIELLVVILIIGVLAAIALPQYQLAKDKAAVKSAFPVMRAIINAENLYKLEHGDYTLNWEELGLEIPHTKLTDDKKVMYVMNGSYHLSNEGTYPHVVFVRSVLIYAAFPVEWWLCYPQGTKRGKALCKSLGCAADRLENTSCLFKP